MTLSSVFNETSAHWPRDTPQRLIEEISLDCGSHLFDEHPSGIALRQAGLESLVAAVEFLQAYEGWTVILEGHCPGRAEQNNDLRESIGEEAADLCKAFLAKSGVSNSVLCIGVGSAQEKGLLVRLSVIRHSPSPSYVDAAQQDEQDLKANCDRRDCMQDGDDENKLDFELELERLQHSNVDVEVGLEQDETWSEQHRTEADKQERKIEIENAEERSERKPVQGEQEGEEMRKTAPSEIEVDQKREQLELELESKKENPRDHDTRELFEDAETEKPMCALDDTVTNREQDESERRPNEEREKEKPVKEVDEAKGKQGREESERTLREEQEKKARLQESEDAGAEQKRVESEPQLFEGQENEKLIREEEAAQAQQEEEEQEVLRQLQLQECEDQHRRFAHEVQEQTRCSNPSSVLPAMQEVLHDVAAKDTVLADLDAGAIAVPAAVTLVSTADPSESQSSPIVSSPKTRRASARFQEETETIFVEGRDFTANSAPRIARCETEGVSLTRAETTGFEVSAEDEHPQPQLSLITVETTTTLGVGLPLGSNFGLVFSDTEAADELCPNLSRAESSGTMLLHDMSVASDEKIASDVLVLPDITNMSWSDQLAGLEIITSEILERSIVFEPNKATISKHSMRTVRHLAQAITHFSSDIRLGCFGHAKGRPSENSDAKRTLSLQRAESLRDALRSFRVENKLVCVGHGSLLGCGLCVRLHVLSNELAEGEVELGNLSWMTRDQQEATLNQLMREALEIGVPFEPNKATLRAEAEPIVLRISAALQSFPDWIVRCEGHAKGKPSENSDAKRHLSQVRAEAFRAAVVAKGVSNRIECVGLGCADGLGMSVRMIALEVEREVEVPNVSGLPQDEQERIVNGVLADVLKRNIDFEPNSCQIPPSGAPVIRALARIVRSLPTATFRIEGHAKGEPSENNEAKRKLSQARAETVRAALLAEEGVKNEVYAVGKGSALGCGMCVRVFVTDPRKEHNVEMPDMTGMDGEARIQRVNQLLEKALEKTIEFEPNLHSIPISGMETVRSVARILKHVPDLAFRCEGHAKGQPSESNEAKRKLSNLRAEAVKSALKTEGVANVIHCVGEGSAQGRGMCVRMCVLSPEELKQFEVEIPETVGLSREEVGVLLNNLLGKALLKNISFEPNRADVHPSAASTVATVARLLQAFPEFPVLIEGHTKGRSSDNNEARIRLSQVRAEAVREALRAEGSLTNEICCVGLGSSQSLGMCVRIFTPDAPREAVVSTQ
eukprot:TRINITY_DN37521_c0_g1_i1.p1 TRINITY_DN37521_c0_g1~~TRINITY_DN37521_c0_g1_i1.p1  ORF type:complete len:1249 (+),score=234.13 TRINITY_DN37521_c0_g1_i1:78-3824(+)